MASTSDVACGRANGLRTDLVVFSQPTTKTGRPLKIQAPNHRHSFSPSTTAFTSNTRESEREREGKEKGVVLPIRVTMASSPSQNISQRYPQRSSFDIRGFPPPHHMDSHGPFQLTLLFSVVEENLIAIGADVRRETGNDVFKSDPQLNEWMQRVRKLGGTADVDDDERAKRLEEVPFPTRCSILSPATRKLTFAFLGNSCTEEGATGTTGW